MFNQALIKAKRGDDKKATINFQLSFSLKDEFDKLCKDNNISVTSMLSAMIETAIEESAVEKIPMLKNALFVVRGILPYFDSYIETNSIVVKDKVIPTHEQWNILLQIYSDLAIFADGRYDYSEKKPDQIIAKYVNALQSIIHYVAIDLNKEKDLYKIQEANLNNFLN